MNREVAAFICQHVFDDVRSVLLVCRSGGDWQFLCGADHAVSDRPKLVGANHLFDRDPTLRAIADLPVDWEAERSSVGGEWVRRPAGDDAA